MSNFKGFKQGIWQRPEVKFVAVFSCIFLFTFTALLVLGLVPSELRQGGSTLDNLETRTLESVSGVDTNPTPVATARVVGEEPLHVTIPKVSVDIVVENPKTKDNTLLNNYLLKGAVRYPDSALLGAGNTLIFGHSSNSSVVNNKAYKAFNGIQNLKRGDSIYVDSTSNRYTYTVQTVSTVRADELYVDFSATDAMLTLSTCDLFGETKTLRFVVTAILDKKESLAQ